MKPDHELPLFTIKVEDEIDITLLTDLFKNIILDNKTGALTESLEAFSTENRIGVQFYFNLWENAMGIGYDSISFNGCLPSVKGKLLSLKYEMDLVLEYLGITPLSIIIGDLRKEINET